MLHEARQVPSWLIFDVRQKKGFRMNVEILVLKSGDESVLEKVAPDVFDDEVVRERVGEFLRDSRHHIAVAVSAGVVVGFASAVSYVHPDKKQQLWINEVSVAEPFRQRGIGKTLMKSLFEVGRGLGCELAWVGTEHSNAPAIALYSSLEECGPPSDFVMFEFKL